ncbi:hypothetical protein BKP37_02655 [Anaerobacillus alkalilacustris]|uniref:GGDEF domain-containing protein n=1 Tax=Anaerobacillus alkalilacustris TaxID=393763 RepID=A0A1S2LY33_9BACI|nr:diguanylate cyclase [Anaerobacillus alkalilacustris]OIJ17422.1 hypothetical protein BKP37_02655 [Anaerobacillus alkalilacustris]
MKKTMAFIIGSFSFVSIYFLWLLFSPESLTTLGSSLFAITAVVISFLLQLTVYRHASGQKRKFLLLFLLATLSYLIAELVWKYQVTYIYEEEIVFPGPSDIFYYFSTILFIVAFFYLVSTNNHRLQFMIYLLDLLIIYATIVVLLSVEFFVPVFKASGFTILETFASTLYPALVLFLLFAIVNCFIFNQNTLFSQLTIKIFLTAISLQVIGDMLFAITLYHYIYTYNSLLEILWSLSILLFGVATYSLSETQKVTQEKTILFPERFKWNVFRMIVQIGCILALHIFYIQTNNKIYTLFLFGTIFLILLRQILSSYHINRLLGTISEMKNKLEEKVIERTEQLSNKNQQLIMAIDKINYMALHDDLTNLLNRRALYENLNNFMRDSKPFTLVFIDVNKFKPINDSFGHNYGDEVLKVIAKLLTVATKDFGIVYRQAGDEFILIINEVDQTCIDEVIKRLIHDVMKPVQIFDQKLTISLSIGISQYPKDAKEIDELIKLADKAMYKSKQHSLECCYSE